MPRTAPPGARRLEDFDVEDAIRSLTKAWAAEALKPKHPLRRAADELAARLRALPTAKARTEETKRILEQANGHLLTHRPMPRRGCRACRQAFARRREVALATLLLHEETHPPAAEELQPDHPVRRKAEELAAKLAEQRQARARGEKVATFLDEARRHRREQHASPRADCPACRQAVAARQVIALATHLVDVQRHPAAVDATCTPRARTPTCTTCQTATNAAVELASYLQMEHVNRDRSFVKGCRECGYDEALRRLMSRRVELGEWNTLLAIDAASRRAGPAFQELQAALQAHDDWRRWHHSFAARFQPDQHPCDEICRRPWRIGEFLAALRVECDGLRFFLEQWVESPDLVQVPTDSRPRRALLNHVEDALAQGGFNDSEIAKLIDDGEGGKPAYRVDRARQRRRARAQRRSPTATA